MKFVTQDDLFLTASADKVCCYDFISLNLHSYKNFTCTELMLYFWIFFFFPLLEVHVY